MTDHYLYTFGYSDYPDCVPGRSVDVDNESLFLFVIDISDGSIIKKVLLATDGGDSRRSVLGDTMGFCASLYGGVVYSGMLASSQ